MPWFFALLGFLVIVVIALVVLGRETARLAAVAKPAVFDLTEAVEFIAESLPADTQARVSHDDVHWVLLADADLLEQATTDDPADAIPTTDDPDLPVDPLHVVDETDAVARIIGAADAEARDILDEDIVAILRARLAYLEAIGAVGPEA